MEENKTLNNSGKETSTTPVMHSFKEKSSTVSTKKALIIFIVVFLLGTATGYGLSVYSVPSSNNPSLPIKNGDAGKNSKIIGSEDTETFKDTTEGIVRKGGINGEGKFHLERPGGESQNVYMISSTVDLSKYIGKKIKVWGQTIDAESAGWLMDVGRIEIL